MLKQQVKDYIEFSGISRAELCRRLHISTQHLYLWLRNEREISDELEERIRSYLSIYSVKA